MDIVLAWNCGRANVDECVDHESLATVGASGKLA